MLNCCGGKRHLPIRPLESPPSHDLGGGGLSLQPVELVGAGTCSEGRDGHEGLVVVGLNDAAHPPSVRCVNCIWFLPFAMKRHVGGMLTMRQPPLRTKQTCSARPMFECSFDWLKGVSWVLFS